MAKKALFFQVTTRDGYGDSTNIYPAQRGDDLKYFLETPHIKVLSIQCIGWHTVTTVDSLGEYYFKIDTLNLEIHDVNVGFNYLQNQFFPTVYQINLGI